MRRLRDIGCSFDTGRDGHLDERLEHAERTVRADDRSRRFRRRRKIEEPAVKDESGRLVVANDRHVCDPESRQAIRCVWIDGDGSVVPIDQQHHQRHAFPSFRSIATAGHGGPYGRDQRGFIGEFT
jgi:hypothetical protein